MNCRHDHTIKKLLYTFLTIAIVSIAALPAHAAPDVDVTDIYTPSSLIALQDTTVTAELTNYGDAGYFYLYMYIDGSWVGTWQLYMDEWSWGTFSVTITGGLTAGYHTISFCASNCRTEGWSWIGTPDLQLTDIYPPTSTVGGQDSIITARIDNNGNANAGPFYVYMYIDGEYVTSWYYSSGLPSRSYSEPYVILTGGLIAGAHNIQFIVDATNTVMESNESNNTRMETFTWTGTPDLEVTDIYDPTSVISGTNTTIKARVTNIGYANAGPFWLDMYIDGQYVASWDFTSGLPAISYSEPYVTITGGLVNGIHAIRFIADSLNEVAESNEANNERTESVTWSGGVPDLELTDIYNPTSLTSGTDTTITAKVTNIGYADATPFYLDMYIDGQYTISVDFSSGLPARTYGEASITITRGLVDGAHNIEFIADSLNEVSESNEGNNNRTESFTWSGGIPDLELTDIYDPTSLVSGEDTTITARVTNIGYADANPFYLDIYVDGEFVGYFDYSTGLPAWYYSEASVTFLGGLPSGDHDIQFIADSLDEVAESNKANNERTETWTWTGPICTSSIGSGIGVLGDNKNHIDTCYISSSDTYNLYDVARRANNNPHGHNGQMADDATIETHYYNTGLMNDPDNVWNASNQASGVDAHVYAAKVYDYLRSTFSLNSFNNQGSSMQSIVEDTSAPNNAYWWNGRVNIGIGSGQLPYSGTLDVVAHEWGHAVTNNASIRQVKTCQRGDTTAGLCYEFESGALNEAFSDWMGTAVEHAYGESNWTMGEGINIIRDLSNPPLYGQPDTYGGQYWYPLGGCVPTQYNDWCGVHTNSGVPNKMFYLLSQGGTHPVSNIAVQGIGISKAIQIAYRANMGYWTNFATFSNALTGMVNAATELYGANSNEVYQVKNAWAAVGVGTIPVVTASASTGGTVSGSGSYEWGSSATVTAIPNAGYIFENWTESGNVVSTSSSYTFTVTGDRTLVANFAPAPVISVSPTSYDFGSYYIGETSPLQTFTVTNIGQDVLNIITVSLTGTDASEFAIYIDTCTGQYLATNGNCTIQIELSPSSEGVKNANLSISSNDPVTPILNVPLSGTGVNDPPVADPNGPYSGIEGQVIILDGSGSYDPDGTITLYEWDVNNDGTYDYYSYSSPTLSYTYSQQGTYTVKLRVTDNLGKIGEAITTANISDTSPLASFTASTASGYEPLTVNFTDTSTAYDGIASRSWNFGDGSPVASGSSVSHVYLQNGIYQVMLTVTDGDGSTDTATMLINVFDTSPTASFTASPTSGSAPLTVNFTNNSTGYDQPLTYAWDFDNNGTIDSTAQNPPYTYTNQGTYTVKLTVTDSDGSTNTLTRTNYISVASGGCANPTVKIGSTYYSSLQTAYNSAGEGSVIQTQDVQLIENLNANFNKTVTIDGGYNCSYATKTGKTSLQGQMTVSNGKVTVKDFILKK